jgi:hypothetical protein
MKGVEGMEKKYIERCFKMLKTEVIKYANGKETIIMRETLAKGRKILVDEGYIQCENPLYYRKSNIIVHYNKTMKGWIVEEVDFLQEV